MCRVLNVKPSSYYDWLSRDISKQQIHHNHCELLVKAAHSETKERYGVDRLHAKLIEQGRDISLYMVRCIFDEHGIKCRRHKRFKVTTDSNQTIASFWGVLKSELVYHQDYKTLLAIGVLFIIQASISLVRREFKPIKALIDNQSIILMAHGEYFLDNLKEANLSTGDVQEVLRKNGVKSKKEVFAVIMETTGDMSVIKNNEFIPDYSLFDDIRDSELILGPIYNTSSSNINNDP